MPAFLIRPGAERDARALATVLNHYIEHSTSTFMTEPVSVDSRVTFICERSAELPIWVAELDGQCIGWAALSLHQPRSAYGHTAESSVYLHPDHLGCGYGTALMTQLVASARQIGYHSLIAGACTEQLASIRLHERVGYTRCAHFHEVARKFGRWLDVVYLERLIGRE
ncbi:GNAT family N-acetyltransferase [Leptothrix discophora]|uniref:N-acetyltransferase family protein n=1 Tax=Leptothrix discophora TaxID=89 RepID=A0ABT9G8E6_LEPDI|nr:GNAT family N-acetyltransferase [Leptothrix discophora]MDP4302731.1 N-acetyltransferase family protein [Leptothrix discophora]